MAVPLDRRIVLLALATAGLVAGTARAATVEVTVDPWNTYAGCNICGGSYAWCGEGLASGTFADPTPPGSLVTSVSVTFWGTSCGAGSEIAVDLEGTVIASQTFDMASTCSCGDCAPSLPYLSADYPDGFPGYVGGGDNTVHFTMVEACSNLYPGQFVVAVTYADTTCGDGVIEGGEQCEDLNAIDGDACTNRCRNAACGDGSVWTIDGGSEACDDGNGIDTDDCVDCALAYCGDGIVRAGVEECDDANDVDTDACADCIIATCGDGLVQDGIEGCDDGNLVDTDACRADCTAAVCGDLVVWVGVEECDDGNARSTDACTVDCTTAACGDGYVHVGFEDCDDGNVLDTDGCRADCTPAFCGDGVVWTGVEECDDGNPREDDGCSITCTLPACGDGVVTEGVEGCDDGNDVAGDGCAACAPEDGYACDGRSPSRCAPVCGDGRRIGAEACDDGNDASGDGCSDACTIEEGWICEGEPSDCVDGSGGDSDTDTDADVDTDTDADVDSDTDVDLGTGDDTSHRTSGGCCGGGSARRDAPRGLALASMSLFVFFFRRRER